VQNEQLIGGGVGDKFEFYDILAVLVPGTLLMACIGLFFPDIATPLTAMKLPDGFALICLTTLSIFLGHSIHAVSSLLDPFWEWTWGGRASERAFARGLGNRYLPAETATRIKGKLAAASGSAEDRSLFLFAMQKAETSENARVSKFNGLFAYHRAILTLLLVGTALLGISMCWGRAAGWNGAAKFWAFVGALAFLLLIWNRTKQRAFYYVREVLLTAERVIDG